MFSLGQLWGREDEILELLEQSALEAHKSVSALGSLRDAVDGPRVLDEFVRLRQLELRITRELTGAAAAAFATSIERGDIIDLSVALYKVPKVVEKFVERLLHSPVAVRDTDFSSQIGLLERAASLLLDMTKALRQKKLPRIQELQEAMEELERQADDEEKRLIKTLFASRQEPLAIIAVKDMYDLLERAIDRCADAADVIAHIALKNS